MVKFSATILPFAMLGVLTRAQDPVAPVSSSCSNEKLQTMAACAGTAGEALEAKLLAGEIDKTICPLVKTAAGCYTDKCACSATVIQMLGALKTQTSCPAEDFGLCDGAGGGAKPEPVPPYGENRRF